MSTDNTDTAADKLSAGIPDYRLDVMVAVYGREAMERVAADGWLEPCPGVRYLLSWQTGDDRSADIPAGIKSRGDVVVSVLDGTGVSRNRNNLLAMATAPYILCADDDIRYRADAMRAVIEAMDARPGVDLAVFRTATDEKRPYPPAERDLGYTLWRRAFYPYLCEVALRREALLRVGLRFDERFGTNAGYLGAGEEDVFCYEAWRRGLRLRYIPIEIVEHRGTTTQARLGYRPEVLRARGAVLQVIYGRLSWLRRLKLALALSKGHPGRYAQIHALLRDGARYVRN